MAAESNHPDDELTTSAVRVTHPRDYQFDRLTEIAVTPAALTTRGSTTHFTVSYDNSLGNGGATIADAVLSVCEADYSTLQGYFGGITPPNLPFNVNILPGDFGGSHATCAATTLSIGAQSASGVNIPFMRSIVIAEEDEVFEAAIGRGWDCGASNGEGLSRVLANAMYPGAEPSNFVSAPSWLDNGRPDFVNNTDPSDTNFVSIGCAVLFLNWLRYQLHFSWNKIILAGATTLAQTYTNLTARTDAWTRFTTLLQSHFPVGRPSGLTTDNPFPLTTTILTYEATTGRVEFGQLDSSGNYQPLQSLPPGSFFIGWSHIVSVDGMLLTYEATTGRVEFGQLDSSGNYQPLQSLPPGSFFIGWSHIVSVNDFLLFYEATTGRVEFGLLDNSGNYQPLQSLPPGSFFVGWSHIVSVNGMLLFYEATTGRVEFGLLDNSGNYQPLQSLPPGSFFVGWSHIVTDLTLGQS